jgi:hypothetical protein
LLAFVGAVTVVAAAAELVPVAPFEVSPEPLDCGLEDVQLVIDSVSTTAPRAPATDVTPLRFNGFPFIWISWIVCA